MRWKEALHVGVNNALSASIQDVSLYRYAMNKRKNYARLSNRLNQIDVGIW